MRKLVAFAVVAALAGIGLSDPPTPLSQQQQNELTTIDELPTQDQLTVAFGSGSGSSTAASQLVTIAADPNPLNVGIRLRAIRSLASFCPPPSGQTTGCYALSPAHQTLTQILNDNMTASAGSDLLVLRAAIEALGQLQVG